MVERSERVNNITEGVIWKQLLIYFFPLMFGTFFQQLYNTVDSIVVGQVLGKEALSAVGGATGTLINLLVGFFVGMSNGATVTVAQHYGSKDKESVSKTVHTAIMLSLIGGIVIMVVGIVVAPTALRWMNTPEDILHYSLTYIRVFFLGMIPNLVYNMGTGILRATGDSKRPLYFLMVGCFTNIVLDILFVAVIPWGVMGAALATIISQALSAILVVLTLMKTDDCYKLELRKVKIHIPYLKQIIRIGIPSGMQSLMYSSTNLIIQTNINGFGTNAVAAWTALGKIDGIFWMIMSSLGISITTFVGQNYGAGKYDRVRKGVRIGLIMAFSITIVLSTVLILGGEFFYSLFTKEAIVIEQGILLLRFLAPGFITYVCIEILSSSLRGMGNTLVPMLLTCVGVCLMRVVWLFTVVPIHPMIETVIFSYPLTWFITSILFIAYYLYFVKKKNMGVVKYS